MKIIVNFIKKTYKIQDNTNNNLEINTNNNLEINTKNKYNNNFDDLNLQNIFNYNNFVNEKKIILT